MRRVFLVFAAFIAISSTYAQTLYELDLGTVSDEQKKAWKLEGKVTFTPEGLVTDTSEDQTAHAMAHSPTAYDTFLDGYDGNIFRITWTFVPNVIGGWGNDFHVPGGLVVEICNKKPILNAKIPAKTNLVPGETCTMSCDFSKHLITSWKINGKEQLDKPTPTWRKGTQNITVRFADFKETKSKTTWKKVVLEQIKYDNIDQLKFAGWSDFPTHASGEKMDFLLAQASPMDKIFREAQLFAGTFDRRISIAAAGRERESFQLVVFPLDKQLKNVTVSMTDLIPEDLSMPAFKAENFTVNPVGYVRSNPNKGPKPNWEWPDVLMPNKPFDVEPGFVQPIWFTANVPHGTAPGEYRGFIHVKADGLKPQMATISLTVRPFSLPLRGKLKTAFCINPGMWEIWYKPDEVKKRLGMTDKTGHGPLYTSYECQDVLPREKWLEMYDFLLAHRLSPSVIYSGLKRGKSRTVPPMEDMQYCYDRGMNANCIVCIGGISKDPKQAEEYLQDLHKWLESWEKFVKEKNWSDFTWYLHSYDETEMRPQDKDYYDYAIEKTHDYVGKHFPWLKRETANPYIERHKTRFDIWTPITSQIKDMAPYKKAQEDGQEVWAYVCCGPGRPYANLFIDFPGVDPRILPWQYYQRGITGFLYYLINFYDQNENWNMEGPKWPERPWNPVILGTNSDGILIYPGPDMTPLASTRLENLRDGIEDYEALEILKEPADAFKPKNDEDKQLLDQARALLAVPDSVTKSWTEYTKDPKVILNARQNVDELIEKLVNK